MNTQKISGGDSWAQFMRLTQDARVRNQGLTNAQNAEAQKSSLQKNTPLQQNFAARLEGYSRYTSQVQKGLEANQPGAIQGSNQAQQAKRTVGTRFDAYA